MDCDVKNKIVVRIRGGLGNQLFGYAFGKNLAIKNNYELILDNYNAFEYDKKQYKRTFELDKFNTSFTYANKKQLLHPFEKIQRNILKIYSSFKNFDQKLYIENFGFGYDNKYEKLKQIPLRFLDGMWQSEKYFIKIRKLLQKEISPSNQLDQLNLLNIKEIKSVNSVALHVRFFDDINSLEYHNINSEYYKKAIKYIKNKIQNPKFFIFSDNPQNVKYKIDLNSINYKIVDNNLEKQNNFKDLLLMKECKNFIIANSTFSWWASWLGSFENKIIICPKNLIDFKYQVTTWGFNDQIPDDWIKL
tara:strand:+ start:23121 stop:24032 length:912 start_codon:yes stop_codon:yes gene_type:complete